MQGSLNHLQINVTNFAKSVDFYRAFFRYFDYKIIAESTDYIGVFNDNISIWIQETEEKYKKAGFHRKKTGINHLAFSVKSKEEVDGFYEEFLKPRNIEPLYRSPKAYPEYSPNHYAVYFEDPDRIKLEVMYS